MRKKDLDERKKKVLQAIVEEYINTAEPVSSGSITKGHGLDYSSATIRNDMAQLESIGFLDKPHTSAGRVPSAEGYRYYVNELLKEDNLTFVGAIIGRPFCVFFNGRPMVAPTVILQGTSTCRPLLSLYRICHLSVTS